MKITKIVELSSQLDTDINKFIKFNEENNYEYLLTFTSPTIVNECLQKLINNGYEVCPDSKWIIYRHKNYDKDSILFWA